MRKRIIACMFALLLAPALARAERVTVARLHEQAEAMGRWTKTYEAHGRTIAVDIPIIVPDVDAFPVVTVEHAAPLTPELLGEVEATAKRVGDAYALTITGEEDGEVHAGDRVELTFITPGAGDEYAPQAGARLSVACNEKDVVPGIGLNEAQAEHWTYAWEREDGVAYAEDNPLTYGEAKAIAEQAFAGVYPQTGGAMSVRMASHIDRLRQNGSDKPVKGAPMGKYLLACSQTFEGIPVLSTPGFRFEPGDSLRFASGGDVFGAFYVHVASANAFHLLTSHSLLRQREIAHADVPLASLDEVMAVVEERILAGHIREVYALELGYFPFADARDGDVAWLYPTWVLSCVYVEDADREENVREVATDGDMPAYMTSTYQEVLLPAQRLDVLTGDWRAAEAKKGSDGFLCPRVDE